MKWGLGILSSGKPGKDHFPSWLGGREENLSMDLHRAFLPLRFLMGSHSSLLAKEFYHNHKFICKRPHPSQVRQNCLLSCKVRDISWTSVSSGVQLDWSSDIFMIFDLFYPNFVLPTQIQNPIWWNTFIHSLSLHIYIHLAEVKHW